MIEKTDFGDVVGGGSLNCTCNKICGYCNCSGWCNWWYNDSAENANYNAIDHSYDTLVDVQNQ